MTDRTPDPDDLDDPDLSDPDLSDRDVPDPDLSGRDVPDPDLSDPDLSDEDLSDEDLSDEDLFDDRLDDLGAARSGGGETLDEEAFDRRRRRRRGDDGDGVDGDGVDDWGSPRRIRRGPSARSRELLVVGAVVLALLLVVVGGSLLPTQTASVPITAAPLVGRTTTVCPVASQPGADATERPNATITAVAIRQAPGREGVLTGTSLAGGTPVLEVTQQGFGAQAQAPDQPVLLQGVGVMSTASSGAIVAQSESGQLIGLSAAPCTAPSTSQWFVGVGAESIHRTDLVLSNPDDAQAEVDLRFFGQGGRVVVPGSPGLIVPAHDTRTVSLDSLVAQSGPLSVWVRATSGRVSAMARDLHSVGVTPAGVDWHPASVGPRRDLVVPGVPDGAGARVLQLVNPDTTRAVVQVSVLGATGAFTPVGAEQVEVAPESTATVSLDAGLAGQGAGIAVRADRPISASVVSTSSGSDSTTGNVAQPDIAVQPAVAPMSRRGVSPVAAVSGTDGTLMLSNDSDIDTTVSFTVSNLSGVTIREGTILVPAHGTSTRRLDSSAGPSYVQVEVPDGSAIYGAVDFAQNDGAIAGLTSLPVTSPDLAARSREAVEDPSAGR